jgi:hypothetical protein
MSKVTWESAFEDSIERTCWPVAGSTGAVRLRRRVSGSIQASWWRFSRRSQPDEWELLTQRLGGAVSVRERVARYVAGQVTQIGTIGVLRGVTKMNGVCDALMRFLAESYDEIREEVAS